MKRTCPQGEQEEIRSSEDPERKIRKKMKTTESQTEQVSDEALTKNIDLDLYSRQYYVYGGKAMSKMAESRVFLSGLGGLGVEIGSFSVAMAHPDKSKLAAVAAANATSFPAKNIALAGVKELTLHDTRVATTYDQASQFFVNNGDLGLNRAEVSAKQVRELNSYVMVQTSTANLEQEDLSFFDQFNVRFIFIFTSSSWGLVGCLHNYALPSLHQCVILTDTPLSLQKKINAYCRTSGIAFIAADVRGVFCWAFCDFGDQFGVHDSNGEEPLEVLIEQITKVLSLLPFGKAYGRPLV